MNRFMECLIFLLVGALAGFLLGVLVGAQSRPLATTCPSDEFVKAIERVCGALAPEGAKP